MQGCKDIHSFVSAFTGSHYYIMDYLAEEVLKRSTREGAFILASNVHSRAHVRTAVRCGR